MNNITLSVIVEKVYKIYCLLQESTETVMQDSTAEDVTETTQDTEDISGEEAAEESRPEVSEDEGVGSENAQSVEDAASPQGSENIGKSK